MIFRPLMIALIVGLLSQASTFAQNLAGKTIVYTAADGAASGYIFVGSSGTIYWSAECRTCGFGGKDKGYRFRLGRSLAESHAGCRSESSSSLSGNVLTLNSTSSCPSLQSTDSHQLTVTLSGDSCTLTQSSRFSSPQTGAVFSADHAQSCRIAAGNQIAR